MDQSYLNILDTALDILMPGNQFTQSKLIEESIKDVLINKYGPEWKDKGELFFECYETLRHNFRKDTYTGDIPYFYSLYYMPLNIPKVQLVLLQLFKRKRPNSRLKILDVGSGVGTTAIALLDLVALLDSLCDIYQHERLFESIEMDFIEGSGENIQTFEQNMDYFRSRLSKTIDINHILINQPLHEDVTRYPIEEHDYDLIIASNILNELPYHVRSRFVKDMIATGRNNPDIVLIEPASSKAVHSLYRLKKELCEETGHVSIAPCGACDQCSECRVFQTCNLTNNELVDFVDELYKQSYKSKYNEKEYNERLKWGYCILSHQSTNTVFQVIDRNNPEPEKVTVSIVGNPYNAGNGNRNGDMYKNNKYPFCDSFNGRGYVLSNEVDIGFYRFGDVIQIEDGVVEHQNNLNVHITKDSSIKKLFSYTSPHKVKIEHIREENLKYLLKRLWGFDEFREGQMELIQAILSGKDVMGILPTGAGKSLCYQLPALLTNGISIIVSPLKSLIKDQINNLKKIGFEFVDYIDSSKSVSDKEYTISKFKTGNLKLLYVAPERLQIKSFQEEMLETLRNFSLDYFIIDEAHCASEWGHDFRPSYLKIRDVVRKMGSPSIIAVTATASPKVREDILEIFQIPPDNVITAKTLNRSEISLQVIKTTEEKKDRYLLEAF